MYMLVHRCVGCYVMTACPIDLGALKNQRLALVWHHEQAMKPTDKHLSDVSHWQLPVVHVHACDNHPVRPIPSLALGFQAALREHLGTQSKPTVPSNASC